MNKIGIFLIFCLLAGGASGQDLPVIVTDSTLQTRIVTDEFLFFADSSGKYTLDDFRSEKMQSLFRKNSADIFLPEAAAYWLEFTLQNPGEHDIDLVLNFNLWDSVNFFYEDRGFFREKITGHFVAYSQRDFPFHDQAFIRLKIAARSSVKCYVRLRKVPQSMYFVEKLSFQISSPEDNFYRNMTERSLAVAFIGIFSVMFFYNLILFFAVKDLNYFWYSGILLANILLAAGNNSIEMGWFPDYYALYRGYYWFTGNLCMSFFLGFFAISFLEMRQNFPISTKLIYASISLNILIGADVISGWEYFALTYVIGTLDAIFIIVLITLTAFRAYFRSLKQAKYYLWGNLIFSLFSLALLIGQAFIEQFDEVELILFQNLVGVGSVFEMIFFSMALGSRITILREEKELAQQKNFQLVEEQNLVLESKVIEKTQEIQQTNSELLAINDQLIQVQEEMFEKSESLQFKNEELEYYKFKIGRSIESAKQIQKAILPTEHKIKRLFSDYFVLWMPKDVVSGDFYWLSRSGGKKIAAMADCTGHGISGAFMTMIGNTLLDRIVSSQKSVNPAFILADLHDRITEVLQQDTTDNTDGMDVALVVIEEVENNRLVTFAGAKRPLYYLSEGEIVKVNGSRKQIGGLSNPKKIFVNEYLELPAGSRLFLCSDGFADQNDTENKKFGEKQLLQVLQENAGLPALEQQNSLKKIFETYSLGTEQRDDVCIFSMVI